MAKQRVGIVFGGKSAEHEVSLQSAKNIVDAIDKSRFDVVLLGIDKQGQWHVNDASQYLLHADDPAHIALILLMSASQRFQAWNRDSLSMPGTRRRWHRLT